MDLRQQAPTITAVCLTVLTTLALGATIFLLRPVLVPFVLAVFLSICAAPVVDLLRHRLRFPQIAAIVVTMLLGLAVLVAISVVATTAVAQLQADRALYEAQLTALWNDSIVPALDRLGLGGHGQPVQAVTFEDRLPAILATVLNELLSLASDGAVVLIYLFFLLASHSAMSPDPNGTWGQVRASIGQYISLKVFVSVLTAVLVWATFAWFGVPLAIVFGLLTFALNFIPNVGSMIAIVLPIPVILMNPALSTTAKVLAIGIPATVQFVIGNVVEPRLLGNSLDLHPIVVLLGLIVWGWLWGMVGVLLAVPMTSALKIVFEQLGYTRPVAELLAGRPLRREDAGPP